MPAKSQINFFTYFCNTLSLGKLPEDMMHRFIIALSCFLMTLAAPISAQDFQKGLAAFNSGDYATALKEWTPLADYGGLSAQFNLGLIYENGWGVPQDYTEAAKWYTRAAEQGNATAQSNVGDIYRNGKGVPQDYREAVKWYMLAAKQGYTVAQSSLGEMYFRGEGVLSSFIIGHMWFNISAANGNETAAKNREIAAKNMTSEDVSKAQAMARVCMNSNYENCGY
jgi:TPR repeat protein